MKPRLGNHDLFRNREQTKGWLVSSVFGSKLKKGDDTSQNTNQLCNQASIGIKKRK
jgi:hypothetical protein